MFKGYIIINDYTKIEFTGTWKEFQDWINGFDPSTKINSIYLSNLN